ncbi:hypothetical protein, partial [Bacillus pumilus]|uniref:hypothetical protein n=1 Tax=Bacillus pumilus TaxID=1408 RepID=UPI001C92D1C5
WSCLLCQGGNFCVWWIIFMGGGVRVEGKRKECVNEDEIVFFCVEGLLSRVEGDCFVKITLWYWEKNGRIWVEN